MEDREGNGVGFEIEFGLTGRRRRPFFGEADVRLAKRQRKSRKPPEYVAFPGRDKAKRQRKKGNQAKSDALRAGKKPKRQRKSRKTPKSDAFPWRDKAKRQRKKGNLAKSAAFRAGKKQKKAAKIEETAGIRCLSPASQSQTNKKHQNRLSLQMNYVILNE